MNVTKFRTMADKLRRDAEGKLRPRETHTAKKLCQARSAEREGLQYQRAAAIIDAYCDASDSGDSLPTALLGVGLTKDEFLRAAQFVSKGVMNGYHSYNVDGKEYAYPNGHYAALRELLEGVKTPEQRAAEEKSQKQVELARKIDALRGCDIPGFFPTPPPVIALMLEAAEIESDHRVLEPSAGLGDIVDAIKATGFSGFLDAIEINSSLCGILGHKGHHFQNFDFLEWKGTKYDRIVMNPPFERKQAISHIRHAYSLLRPGGRIVALLPPNHASELAFKTIEKLGIPDNAFNSSGAFRRTGVSVAMVVIDKPFVSESTGALQGELFV